MYFYMQVYLYMYIQYFVIYLYEFVKTDLLHVS